MDKRRQEELDRLERNASERQKLFAPAEQAEQKQKQEDSMITSAMKQALEALKNSPAGRLLPKAEEAINDPGTLELAPSENAQGILEKPLNEFEKAKREKEDFLNSLRQQGQ